MTSWRNTQLTDANCKQDQIILNLFQSLPVRYIGHDQEFAQRLQLDNASPHVILIFNQKFWISDLISTIKTNCNNTVTSCYIGINRYCLMGNDTDLAVNLETNMSVTLINLVSKILCEQGINVTQSGHYDQDLGRRFNFVQPLTWVYGTNINN